MTTGVKKAVTSKLLVEASFLHLSIFAGKPHDKATTSPNLQILLAKPTPRLVEGFTFICAIYDPRRSTKMTVSLHGINSIAGHTRFPWRSSVF
jgi:hypothetical protein